MCQPQKRQDDEFLVAVTNNELKAVAPDPVSHGNGLSRRRHDGQGLEPEVERHDVVQQRLPDHDR